MKFVPVVPDWQRNQTKIELQLEPEMETEMKMQLEPGMGSKMEPETNPGTEAEMEPETETEIKPGVELG